MKKIFFEKRANWTCIFVAFAKCMLVFLCCCISGLVDILHSSSFDTYIPLFNWPGCHFGSMLLLCCQLHWIWQCSHVNTCKSFFFLLSTPLFCFPSLTLIFENLLEYCIQYGTLPMKYFTFGTPVDEIKIRISAWKPTKNKAEIRLAGWQGWSWLLVVDLLWLNHSFATCLFTCRVRKGIDFSRA